MTKTRTNFVENKAHKRESRALVSLWYDDRCEVREERYRAVRTRPVMVREKAPTVGSGHPAQPWDKSLTADGRETRDPRSYGSARGGAVMNVEAAGGYEVNHRLVLARYAMLLVINVEPMAHHALEMEAAGYALPAIAAEIGCGEPKARELLATGLSVVSTIRIVRKEINKLSADSLAPEDSPA